MSSETDHDDASGQVTRLLAAIGQGETQRLDDLLSVVYAELHRLAEAQMKGERKGHTLQATALVHEAYLRLLGGAGVQWQNRAHFFTAAGEAMRRILVDQARRRLALKRGGDQRREEMPDDVAAPDASRPDLLALDAALLRLEASDSRMANIVKLRYFVELSVDETASALGISRRTVLREWTAAKAWLQDELSGERPGP